MEFFRDHKRCARFGEIVSQFRSIYLQAYIIQGSVIGPVSYVGYVVNYSIRLTTSSFKKLHRQVVYYADNSCCIIPAASVGSYASDIANVEK